MSARSAGAFAVILALVIGAVLGPLPVMAQNADPMERASIEQPQRFICGMPIYKQLVQEGDHSGSRALAATGDHAYIYVDGGNPSQDEVNSLMEEFDHKIWPADTTVFGTISKDKINIHIDTIDGPYGIGGYYIPGTWDIYVDAADLNIWGFEVTAHEFEHLIMDKHDQGEELWVNEGMADLAIHIIYGPGAMSVSGHLSYFMGLPDNDLTVFENEMWDYGSAYAWTLWAWEHFGGNDTIRTIVNDQRKGFSGYTGVLRDTNPAWSYTDIQLFSMWSVANILDDTVNNGGLYGYYSVDMSMLVEGTFDTYPTETTSDVNSWANDYYGFRNGDKRDLALLGSRLDGSINFSLIGVGPADVLIRSGIVTSSQPQTELVIPNFGSRYHTIYLAVSGWQGQRYKFQADLRDNTPPKTALAVSPETPDGLNGFYVTMPTLGFVTSEPATTYFHWDDGKDVQYCQSCSPPRVPEAMEGNHTIFFYSVDPEGNEEKPVNYQMFMVDTIRPETYANVTPMQPNGEKGWYVSPVTVSLSSEPGSIVLYRWDSGFFHNYTGTMMADEGVHTVYYYSKDIAGNEGDTHSLEIKIDTLSPIVKYDVYPIAPDGQNGYYRTAPTVALAVDEPKVTILYSIDASATFVYQNPVKIGEGKHSIEFWAVDEAGNEARSETLDFLVDSVTPSSRIKAEPVKPDGTNGWYVTEPSVYLETDKDALVYYILDDGVQRRYVSPIQVGEGNHTIRYWSKDKAGNVEPERTYSIKVDMTPPETKCRSQGTETNGWYLDPPTITMDLEPGATGYYMWDDGSENKYIIPLRPKDGSHKITCYAVDAAGNVGPERSLSFLTDTIDPVAFFTTTPAYAFTGKEVIFDATNASDNIELVSYSFDFGDGSIEDLKGDQVINHVYSSPGTYRITLTVVDQAGRKASYTREVFVERPPKKEDGITGILDNPFILLLGLVILIALLGVGVYRYRRQKALERALAAYEAYMAQRAEAEARANRAKAKKGARRGPVKTTGPAGPKRPPAVRR